MVNKKKIKTYMVIKTKLENKYAVNENYYSEHLLAYMHPKSEFLY